MSLTEWRDIGGDGGRRGKDENDVNTGFMY